MKTMSLIAGIVSLGTLIGSGAEAADKDALLADALSAAPDEIAMNATVRDWDGNVLQEGSNGYTCLPTRPDLTARAPMCVDKEWLAWAKAWKHNEVYHPAAVGIAYMLAGDGGASNITPNAKGPTADNQWVVEGPHLMIIVPDNAALAGISTDPENGGPYVMWKDTPYAHIMVPTTGK